MKFTVFRRVVIRLTKEQLGVCYKKDYSSIAIEAKVTFIDPVFNENNFVIDHNTISEVLSTILKIEGQTLSCEFIAREAVKQLLKFEGVNKVEAKVYPNNMNTIAYMICEGRNKL